MPRSSWDTYYALAQEYFCAHGHLLVPGDYRVDGKALGAWIGTQRANFRTGSNSRFTQERVDRLNAIGMVWDVSEHNWQSMCRALEEYVRQQGTARVPQSFVTSDGKKLGIWLNMVRMQLKRGALSPQRQSQLEELGVIWNPEALRRSSWETYFRLLEAYVKATGSFPAADHVTQEGLKLGTWLSNQRQKYRRGSLLSQRQQRLEELGIRWQPSADIWERRYQQAREYFLRWGHLCPMGQAGPSLPAGLSQWLGSQRQQQQVDTLSPERVRRLEEIGMLWDVRSQLWEASFQQAKAFYLQYGHLRVPKDSGPPAQKKLGRWISSQRKNYAKGGNPFFTPQRIRRLEEIGMVWNAKPTPEQVWKDWFQKAEAFFRREGHLLPSKGRLRTWLLAQRAAKKGKRGSLTPEQVRQLEAIGMVWEPVEVQWLEMYRRAQEYHRVHHMLNIPCGYVTDDGARLGQWIARQRKAYKNYLSGRRGSHQTFITPQRIALLNDLGMIWDGTACTARTSFPEKALLFYLRQRFPDAGKRSQWQEPGVELDIYLPGPRTAIEYDGAYWHRDKVREDEEKGMICRENGIRLIRIREPGLPPLCRCDLLLSLPGLEEPALEDALAQLFSHLGVPAPDVDLVRDRTRIMATYRDYTARQWDRLYQEVQQYHSRQGSLSIPPGLKSRDGISLAHWLHSQRTAYHENQLTALQIKKLEQLGMEWSPFQDRWQRMYSLARDYAQAHGDLMIPATYVTAAGDGLGHWLAAQREKYRLKKLTPRQINGLEALGILWSPLKNRQDRYWAAARAFYRIHGHLDIPAQHITREGLRLGEWLVTQRSRYRARELSPQQVQELESMAIRWSVIPDRWEEMFLLARSYFQTHGHLWVPPDYVSPQGQRLGAWVAQQRQKRSGKGRHALLTAEQRDRLEQIGMVWDPYTAKWMEKYRLARAFYEANGHLNIPRDYVTAEGVKLGMWLSSQRQGLRGNPNFRMTAQRKALLDELGMDWSLRRSNPNARHRPGWEGLP